MPPPDNYLIIESNRQLGGWRAVLKYRTTIYFGIKEEKISRYDSGTYQTIVTATNAKIIAAIKAIEKFKLFIISGKSFTLRTYYQAIVAFYNKKIRK